MVLFNSYFDKSDSSLIIPVELQDKSGSQWAGLRGGGVHSLCGYASEAPGPYPQPVLNLAPLSHTVLMVLTVCFLRSSHIKTSNWKKAREVLAAGLEGSLRAGDQKSGPQAGAAAGEEGPPTCRLSRAVGDALLISALTFIMIRLSRWEAPRCSDEYTYCHGEGSVFTSVRAKAGDILVWKVCFGEHLGHTVTWRW